MYTKGKWESRGRQTIAGETAVFSTDYPNENIAFVFNHRGEVEANACLIAAAPQMLDALHFVRGGINGESVLSEHLRVVDEAIEAAESIETLIERVRL